MSKEQLKQAAQKITEAQSSELALIRSEMSARQTINMTPARLRKAGIPSRAAADQLAKHYGMTASDHGGGYWHYRRPMAGDR